MVAVLLAVVALARHRPGAVERVEGPGTEAKECGGEEQVRSLLSKIAQRGGNTTHLREREGMSAAAGQSHCCCEVEQKRGAAWASLARVWAH